MPSALPFNASQYTLSGTTAVIIPIGKAVAGIQLTGTWTGTVAWSVSLDGANPLSVNLSPAGGGSAVASTTANGIWGGSMVGGCYLHVTPNLTGGTTATLTVTQKDGGSAGTVQLDGSASVAVNNFPATQAVSVADGQSTALGTTTDTAVYDAAGSVNAHVRGTAAVLNDVHDGTNHGLQVTWLDKLDPTNDQVAVGVSATANGATPYKNTAVAASTNATSVKASAGRVFSIELFNFSTTNVAYFKFYDKASAPSVGTDVPVKVIAIPAGSSGAVPAGIVISGTPAGIQFSSGIAYAITGALADSDATNIAANQVAVNFDYH